MAELLRAGRRKVYDVWLAEGVDPSPILVEIVAEAERRRIPVRHTARVVLEREAATDAPQGVLAHAAPVPEVDLDDLCRPGADVPMAPAPSSSPSTGSPIPGTWAPSCAAPTEQGPPAPSSPGAGRLTSRPPSPRPRGGGGARPSGRGAGPARRPWPG